MIPPVPSRMVLAFRFLVLCLALAASVPAQDKPTLGVLDVAFLPRTDDDARRDLYTSLVRGRAIDLTRGRVDVIEGAKLERLIEVNAKSCDVASCLAQFARNLGVDYLLDTRVIGRRGEWSVTVSLASSGSSSLLAEKVADFANEAQLRKGLPELVSRAMEQLGAGGRDAPDDGGEAVAAPPPGARKVIVAFASEPTGAAVSVDGEHLCTTPCSRMVMQGDHRIAMAKEGYARRKELVRAERNDQPLDWTLEASAARLSLTAVDDRTGNDLVADVYVDGTKVGQTPFDSLVAVDARVVEVAPEGFERKEVPVELREGTTARATAHFRSEPMSKASAGMVAVPGGCFLMGSPDGVGWKDEHPRHKVCLDGYSIDARPVTQTQFNQVMGRNPSYFAPESYFEGHRCVGECPVEQVTWDEADDYCRRLGKRLPTEAQYEYAQRAGNKASFYWGGYDGAADEHAWSDANSQGRTHPVGQRKPNDWGLYDMAGNVLEWCADRYGETYYGTGPERNPEGPESGSSRVCRGGSWARGRGDLRSAFRYDYPSDERRNDLGFRCVSP